MAQFFEILLPIVQIPRFALIPQNVDRNCHQGQLGLVCLDFALWRVFAHSSLSLARWWWSLRPSKVPEWLSAIVSRSLFYHLATSYVCRHDCRSGLLETILLLPVSLARIHWLIDRAALWVLYAWLWHTSLKSPPSKSQYWAVSGN